MNREQMIEWLIDDDLGLIQRGAPHDDFEYVAGILREGFKGYQRYTDEELRQDILERTPEGAAQ
jgi:hypothetical protein